MFIRSHSERCFWWVQYLKISEISCKYSYFSTNLWVLIGTTLAKCVYWVPTTCFQGEIRKIPLVLGWKKRTQKNLFWNNGVPVAYVFAMKNIYEPAHDKPYNLRNQWRLRSACASGQSDQSSLIAWAFYSLRSFQRGINKNSCQTGWS